jgi:hypothetical protein
MIEEAMCLIGRRDSPRSRRTSLDESRLYRERGSRRNVLNERAEKDRREIANVADPLRRAIELDY